MVTWAWDGGSESTAPSLSLRRLPAVPARVVARPGDLRLGQRQFPATLRLTHWRQRSSGAPGPRISTSFAPIGDTRTRAPIWRPRAAMLGLALRYLMVVVVIAVGFALLQGGEWASTFASKPGVVRNASHPTPARESAESEDSGDSEYSDESDESGYGDESDAESASAEGEESAGSDESYDSDANADSGDSDAWEYVVEAGSHGHFVIEAVVDGVPLTFLLDTGASEIILTLADARRLGYPPQRLEFSQRFRTANGEVRAAPVRLRELRVGQFSLYDLDASVNEAPLAISLLGMSFLDRLNGYEVKDGRLILRW